MKAISLWQPWAGLMEIGVKRNETRGWKTSHRGDLAICASKWPKNCPLDLLAKIRADPKAARELNSEKYGVVLCVVRLHGIVPTEVEKLVISVQELAYGDYSNGRYAWQTDNLRPLKSPVPLIGKQGIFDLDPEVEKQVRDQLIPL